MLSVNQIMDKSVGEWEPQEREAVRQRVYDLLCAMANNYTYVRPSNDPMEKPVSTWTEEDKHNVRTRIADVCREQERQERLKHA